MLSVQDLHGHIFGPEWREEVDFYELASNSEMGYVCFGARSTASAHKAEELYQKSAAKRQSSSLNARQLESDELIGALVAQKVHFRDWCDFADIPSSTPPLKAHLERSVQHLPGKNLNQFDQILVIQTIGVLEANRNNGVASLLIDIAKNYAAGERCDWLYAYAESNVPDIVQLYHKNGFQAVASVSDWDTTGFEDANNVDESFVEFLYDCHHNGLNCAQPSTLFFPIAKRRLEY